ncbi:SDR family oxidoreductase [Azospirillum sp. RWY-5-1]|uniref:SDR family oxidoreductase n=1 Tax=Azospirillum oleiclasticum TaxID=2735135 RepID=A0ABX2TN08_9PROT|nr:SDR family oxidoreductase [Azospirillum oleiclasticum]NYZ25023.1 SDR family oxidoreductase [Azospirillum oleiclasticum]
MKAVVTGAAGFIGSHLVDRLLSDGFEVIGIDNFANGNPGNIARAAENPRFSFLQADVADHDVIAPAFEGVDRVFHLAALADIVPSIERPLGYHRANVDGTVSVLEAARLAGAKRFVYAASSSCYGLAKEFPTPETATVAPAYPYALTKWMGECCVTHWNQVYGLPTVSLRLFNVYGPRARTSGTYGAVFGVFLAQKLAGKPFTVVGDGTQTRDFTFVSDVVAAFAAAGGSDLSGEIMNVGSGGTHAVNRLVELLGGPVVHIPKRPGEPDCTFADTARIRERLGWRPRVSFEQGVGVMLEHIEDWREAPVWDQGTIADATRSWFRYLKG